MIRTAFLAYERTVEWSDNHRKETESGCMCSQEWVELIGGRLVCVMD